jgi:hypothetical protein
MKPNAHRDEKQGGTIMRALIVYESLYGNTHIVANSIADGLREGYEVTVVPVTGATINLVTNADLLVVGGPTHLHGMSSTSSRKMAADAASKPGSGLTLEPDSVGPGLRNWLHEIGHGHGAAAAAFDTRLDGPAVFTGRASLGISHRLRRHGYRLVLAPESFLISKQSALIEGEAIRARTWGAALAVASGAVSHAPRAETQ